MTINSTKLLASVKVRFVAMMVCIVVGFTGGVFHVQSTDSGIRGLRQKNRSVSLGRVGQI